VCDSQQIGFFCSISSSSTPYQVPLLRSSFIIGGRSAFRWCVIGTVKKHSTPTDREAFLPLLGSIDEFLAIIIIQFSFGGWEGNLVFLRYTDLGSTIEYVRTWSRRSQGDIPNTTLTKPTANSWWTHTHTHHT